MKEIREQLLRLLVKTVGPVSKKLGLSTYLRPVYRRLQPNRLRIKVSGTKGIFETPNDVTYSWVSGYSDPMLEDILAHLRPGDIVYDIGGHIGVYGIIIANALERGSVVVFEPHPENAKQVRRNATLNPGSVEVIECALSNADGTAELEMKAEDGGIGTHALATEASERTVEVRAVTGDGLVREGRLPPPDVVKIDVEGAELRVLEGLTDTLRSGGCRLVYCEIHLPQETLRYETSRTTSITDYGGKPEEVHDLLESLGFTVEIFGRQESRYSIRAARSRP